jgi:hypothetical protein
MFKKSLLSLSVACLLTAVVPTAVMAQTAPLTTTLVPAPALHGAIPIGSKVTGGTATTAGGVTTVTGATVTLPGGGVLTNVTIVNAAVVNGAVVGGAVAQSALAAIGATAAVAAGTTLAAGTVLGIAVVAGVLVTVVSDGTGGTVATTGTI